ncbi:DUF2339 domain-containing protein [Thermoactinomyces sp. CICC 10522]|nr:DUF2339 domain-containing protein [Thermoactinomyces sp. CICC 10522]
MKKGVRQRLNFFMWLLLLLLSAGWIYLFLTVNELKKRVIRIEKQMKPQAEPAEASQPAAKPEKPMPGQPVAAKPGIPVPDKPSVPVQSVPKKEAKAKKPSRPKRNRKEWEYLIGGRWLNRIGAVALVIGLVFFVKYAFDYHWVNEIVRVLMGGAFGILLLAGGRHYYRKQLPIFAQGLIGAGTATLYASVYAAFDFYHFLSFGMAILLMSLVTMLALWQALVYDSLAISLLGWIGAFITLPVLGADPGNQVGLFTYLVFVALGMVLISLKKRNWTILYHLTLYAIYVCCFALMTSSSHSWHLLYLTAFWLIFYLYELAVARKPGVWPAAHLVTASFNAFFMLLGLLILPLHHAVWTGEKVYLFSVAYLLPLAWLKWKRREREFSKTERNRYGFTFLFLVTLAGMIKWNGLALANVWTIESFVLVWLALREKVKQAFYFGTALYGIAALLLLGWTAEILSLHHWIPVWNRETFSYFLWAGMVTFQACQIRKSRTPGWEPWFEIFYTGSAIMLFFWLSIEINIYFDRSARTGFWELNRYFVLYMIWALYSLLVHETGLRQRVRVLVPVSWGMMFLALVSVAVWGMADQPLSSFVPVFNMRFLAFLVEIGCVILMLWRGRKAEPLPSLKWAPVLLLGALLVLLFEIVTLEVGGTSDYFAPAFGDYTRAQWYKGFFISLSWIGYSLLCVWLGRSFRQKLILFFAWGSLGLGVLSVMFQGLFLPARINWMPVINIRFAALFISAACLYLYQSKGKALEAKRIWVLLARILLVVLLFELITVEISGIFAHRLWELNTGNPVLQHQIENQKQLALSISWIFYSLLLMLTGIWRKWAWLRWSAISLFGLSILKIFLFDLSSIETLYRIVSFMALGVILLAVSYLYQRYRERF